MKSSLPSTAFILQIHNNPEQVNKFIHQLISGKKADVYVHIDKKYYGQLSKKILVSPNVKVIENSVVCEWGDISQVDATLLLLKEVVSSEKVYDYVCLRSGQDLLVKDKFKDFLVENSGKVFMNYHLMVEDLAHVKLLWPKITRQRYTSIHPIRIYRSLLQLLYRKGLTLLPNNNYWPKDYIFYKGSQWFTIPYEVAKYIIDFLEENDWYYRFFESTLIPDEIFFHTLVLNSPYKELVVNNSLYYMKWGETLEERNSPQYLRKEDIANIEASNTYFARKFDVNIDSKVVDYFSSIYRFEEDANRSFLKTI